MTQNKRSTETLIAALTKRGLLTDTRVEAAFAAVPRDVFLPNIPLESAFADVTVPVRLNARGEATCTATMPSMLAFMLQELDLQPGHNLLEVGTGTGYTVALMRHLLGKKGVITSLEIERDIAEHAKDALTRANINDYHIVVVDGAEGYAPRAQYDRMMVTAGIWDVPLPWIRQLKPDGRIVAPVWLDGLQVAACFTLQEDGTLYSDRMTPSTFVYIRGQAAGPQVRKRIGSTGLILIADDIGNVDPIALATLLSSDHEAVQLSKALNKWDYWYGFLPYLMLDETDNDLFALYSVLEDGRAYGIEGEGFVISTPASACFVPYYGVGFAHSFAGSDAFLAVESKLADWEAAGRPGLDCLRLRFVPKAQGKPVLADADGNPLKNAKIYERRDHYLAVWMEDCP